MNNSSETIINELTLKFGDDILGAQNTVDSIPTIWVKADGILKILKYLKTEIPNPYRILYDLTAIDDRERKNRPIPASDFTIVYHLLSFSRNSDVRIKVPLAAGNLSIHSIIGLWESADWYEREVYDMFGITFEGHPRLWRILMPRFWKGYPLRKEHPARATELGPFSMTIEQEKEYLELERFDPSAWGMRSEIDGHDLMFLNIGPNHPGTHGVFRIILQLDDELIEGMVCEIGFHHRGAEKMGERQSWHTYIPYTDRVDYLSGVLNEFPYCMTVERLAGIEVPDKAKVIRIMTAELFRIISHLVWYGTFVQDLGAMSPVFYMFTDRERAFDIIEAVTGARMHPGWFRIGGVAQDLPIGWEKMIADFVVYMRKRLREYDRMVMSNSIFKARTKGIGVFTLDQAIEWGITGPGLRACGLSWDFRKQRAYSGYDQFQFDIPTATHGDCYDRAVVHVEEMRQSLRIIEQCIKNMPEGPYIANHPSASPPRKANTMKDIETLITHFLNVSWGPVIPPGEAAYGAEGAKGNNTYYLVSDGGTASYRTRIRTPSFPHLQMLPLICKGYTLSDLVAVLGAVDFVLADVDR